MDYYQNAGEDSSPKKWAEELARDALQANVPGAMEQPRGPVHFAKG